MKFTEKIRYKLYRLKWLLAPFFSFSAPVHLDIEANNNCNLRCVFCWHSNPSKLPFKISSMPIDRISDLLDQAAYLGVKSIKFNLRGEFLLNKNLSIILIWSREKFIDVMLNTNGTVEKRVFDLALNYFNTISLSLDAFDSELYKKIHGCNDGPWINVLNNIRLLQKYYYDNKSKNFRASINYHVNTLNQDEDIAAYRARLWPLKINIKRTEKRLGADVSIKRNQGRKRKRICPHMMRRLTILVNGKTYPCCVCYSEPEDIQLGNAFVEPLEILWKSEKRKQLIKNYKKGIYANSCKNCTSADIWKK